MKAQGIRIADVIIIGPLMVWGGFLLATRYPMRGKALALMGAGTMVYNAGNYFKARAQQ